MITVDDFSNRLKILMETHELSAALLAEEIGINRSTLSHLLSGRNKPSLDLIVKLNQRFPEYSLSWLILGKEDSNDTPPPSSPKIDSSESSLEKTIQTQSSKTQKNTVESNIVDTSIERIVIFYADGTFKAYQNV